MMEVNDAPESTRSRLQISYICILQLLQSWCFSLLSFCDTLVICYFYMCVCMSLLAPGFSLILTHTHTHTHTHTLTCTHIHNTHICLSFIDQNYKIEMFQVLHQDNRRCQNWHGIQWKDIWVTGNCVKLTFLSTMLYHAIYEHDGNI